MQGNNYLRPFSTSAVSHYTDAELATESAIASGAISGASADSKLYNSLSMTTTLLSTAIADFLALHNPSVNFGQTLSINDWISAVNGTVATVSSVSAVSGRVSDLEDGTTPAAKATNADNATTVQNVNFSANTAATFGNYTVSKRQLLWSGSQSVPTGSSVTINLLDTLMANQIIEIEVGHGTHIQFYKFRLGQTDLLNGTIIGLMSIPYMEVNSSGNFYLQSFGIKITASTLTAEHLFAYWSDGTPASGDATIYSVYKIIE